MFVTVRFVNIQQCSTADRCSLRPAKRRMRWKDVPGQVYSNGCRMKDSSAFVRTRQTWPIDADSAAGWARGALGIDLGERHRTVYDAEIYEAGFAAAVTQRYASLLADIARARPGQRVLDVACGTGVLARVMAHRVGRNGKVIGIDCDRAMLGEARRQAPGIEWLARSAEELGFEDSSFDCVVSQFGLMFLDGLQRAAISEMVRVLAPGGCLAVAVWSSFEGYEELMSIVPPGAAEDLRQAFSLSNDRLFAELFPDSGLAEKRLSRIESVACFSSVEEWLAAEVGTWAEPNRLSRADISALAGRDIFRPFRTASGAVALKNSALVFTGVRT